MHTGLLCSAAAMKASAKFAAVAAAMPSDKVLKQMAKAKSNAFFKHRARWDVAQIIKEALRVEQGVQVRIRTGVQMHSGSTQKPLLKVKGSLTTVQKVIKALPLAGELRTTTIPSERPVGTVKRLTFEASSKDAWNFADIGVRQGTRGKFTKFVPCQNMKMCKTALTVTWLSTKDKTARHKLEDAKSSYELCSCGNIKISSQASLRHAESYRELLKKRSASLAQVDQEMDLSGSVMDLVQELPKEGPEEDSFDESSSDEFGDSNDDDDTDSMFTSEDPVF